MTRILLGILAGAIIGGVVGYALRCAGGACPLTCNPVGGLLFGGLVGAILMGSSVSPREREAEEGPSSNVVEIVSETQFSKLLQDNPVVLADFYADWCAPCRMLKPTLHQLADDYAGRVLVVVVNVDKMPRLATAHAVRSTPDVILFREGNVAQAITGVLPKTDYAHTLDRALAAPRPQS